MFRMDSTFYRLLWLTLIAVAFTFSVILTNVFVDIDNLLSKRRLPIIKPQPVTETLSSEPRNGFIADFQGYPSNEDDIDENESTLRTKRSLETNNYLLHKNPNVKKFLTDHLATLLEELDEEDSLQATKGIGVETDLKDKNIANQKHSSTEKVSLIKVNDTTYGKSNKEIDHTDVLHLAMHNILLQGIIGHMDLNEVYKRIHSLIKSFDNLEDSESKGMDDSHKFNKSKPSDLVKFLSHDTYNEEEKFLNELIKCEKLQKLLSQRQDLQIAERKGIRKGKELRLPDSGMLIKTIIEITNNNGRKIFFKNSDEKMNNDVTKTNKRNKLESFKDPNTEIDTIQSPFIEENRYNLQSYTDKLGTENNILRKPKLEEAIAEYLKTHSIKFHNNYNVMTKGSIITKRLKRQIKIRFLKNHMTTEKSKQPKVKPKHHDDELYVEIETHFDGKGIKGEKKKKLVRTLIDKIQKAINTNDEILDHDKNVQQKHLQIKKRMQNPIDHKGVIINKTESIRVVEHRLLNPISKTTNTIQPLTSVLGKSGDTWKKIYNGPGFLTVSKSLNSAEMNELDIDYNTVMKNGIPKRLQKPITTENEDFIQPLNIVDNNMSNVKLLLKDINGSGFSIGINQYTDEPPDKESLKIFSQLEKLIQAYRGNYDQTVSNESQNHVEYISETNHDIKRRHISKQIKRKRLTTLKNEGNQEQHIIEFTQRNRQKRNAMNVNLYSNIKYKTKLNKFINTNAMPTKKILLKKKRNKRQIGNIRIITSNRYPSRSKEEIFLNSREKIYSDRAIVKEEEVPEVEIGDRTEEHYDFIATYPFNIHNLQPAYTSSDYDTKSLHTELMSKYPHVFFENKPKSNEEYTDINPSIRYRTGSVEEKSHRILKTEIIKSSVNKDKSNEKSKSSTNVDEIVNAILPSRNNFKVVVKILPKNRTSGTGYKEVHTLINKSYDKNGVRYVSLLNVSEVSKSENLNKTNGDEVPVKESSDSRQRQNQIKLLLELHKKRIDQQMENLKTESQKIKQMIGKAHINNINYLYDTNFFPSNDNEHEIYSTTIPLAKTLKPKSVTTITPQAQTTQGDSLDKVNILKSIKQNDNITKEILAKIDKNTNTLQLLLQTFWGQTQSVHSKVNTNKMLANNKPKYLEADPNIGFFLEKLQPNFTNAIPFIYAFQHPLMENKENTVANVIYHGHIHATKVGVDEKKNNFLNAHPNNLKVENKEKIKKNRGIISNETKFFIDDLENDFKPESNVNDRISILNSIATNTTKS